MFQDYNNDSALAISRRITIDHVARIMDDHVEANLVGEDHRFAILAQVTPLLRLMHSSLGGDPFWELFQHHFGFHSANPKIVPMNAANLCPEPDALINTSNLLRSAYNRNVSQQVRTAGGERVRQLESVRTRLARSLGLSDPADLALIRNSSEGNNAINCGYRNWTRTSDVSQLDTVVVWEENHPTNLEAWRLRRDSHAGRRAPDDQPKPGDPFQLIVVKLDRNDSAEQIAEAFIRHIDSRTRFVTFSETSNDSGMRIPDAAIGMIWRHVTQTPYPDCHVHIDGTMSWGARRVNLGDAHCHSFVSSAHKWFLGPKETGILYMDKRKARNFLPSIFAYDYRIQIGKWDQMPENSLRFEMLGQRDDVNLITLDITQLMWDALQARAPYARIVLLASRLVEALVADGWSLKTPEQEWKRWGIVRVEAPKKPSPDSPSLYDWMYGEERPHRFGGSGGSGPPGEQTFRLCPHIYNTMDDINRALTSMKQWRLHHGA